MGPYKLLDFLTLVCLQKKRRLHIKFKHAVYFVRSNGRSFNQFFFNFRLFFIRTKKQQHFQRVRHFSPAIRSYIFLRIYTMIVILKYVFMYVLCTYICMYISIFPIYLCCFFLFDFDELFQHTFNIFCCIVFEIII